jgi:uncharacterized NAD(P)/FAD-binding protein YdhS
MTRPVSVAIVGAGPRGLGMLERLVASAPELLGTREVQIHLVDPYPAGGGRIWRTEQPVELLMNSLPEDVTMYVDDTVRCRGPIRNGPTLLGWAQERSRAEALDEAERQGFASVVRGGFVSRRMHAGYLSSVLDGVLAALPPSVTVSFHESVAEDLHEGPDGRQRLTLAGGDQLDADAVILTLGHLDVAPDEQEVRLGRSAEQAGLRYVPPQHTADADLSFVRPGDEILVRGMGLAFVDLMALLFEGCGGRFHPTDEQRLVYEPSGNEPTLLVGSRRGVPYRAKSGQGLIAERAPLPRFFTRAALARLLREHPRVDMWAHVRPLIEKEVGWGYYYELFNAHPDRVQGSWAEFAQRYADADPAELGGLVAETVSPDDVLDLDERDRPLAGLILPSLDPLQAHLREHLQRDVRRRTDPAHSAEAGAFQAFLSVFNMMGLLWHSGRLDARSQTAGLDWWKGQFNYFTSGPPAHRLLQLDALSEAGFVRFLGAGMWVEVDEGAGTFRAGSATTPETVSARTLVDARLPEPSIARVRDPLLRALADRGEISEETVEDNGDVLGTGLVRVTPSEARLVDAAGDAHPARFALGMFTTLRSAAAFHRPCTGSAGFRQNDFVARTALTAASRVDQPERTT